MFMINVNFIAERIRNAIITGPSIGVFHRKKIACIIDVDNIHNNSMVNSNSNGIEFKGDVHNLINDMERNVMKFKLLYIAVFFVNVKETNRIFKFLP